MTRLRRFAALLMGVLVVQLALPGGAAACAMTGERVAHAVPPAGQELSPGGDHHSHRPADAPTRTDAPDEAPAGEAPAAGGPIDCPMAVGCGSMTLAHDVAPLAGAVAFPEAPDADPAAHVPSRTPTAPEPPPPRG